MTRAVTLGRRMVVTVGLLCLAAGVLAAVPTVASGVQRNGLPPGLQPTEVNITNDVTQRFGEPEIAVNPRNPNNIVYYIKTDATTYACEASGNPNCATFVLGQRR
jgi:hypothetical protein